jgi:GPR1/FUN34/yaaH family
MSVASRQRLRFDYVAIRRVSARDAGLDRKKTRKEDDHDCHHQRADHRAGRRHLGRAAAASAENGALTAVLVLLAVGATLLAIALIGDVPVLRTIGGWVLIASAIVAWYTATAMMLEGTFKRPVFPLGRRGAARPPEPDAQLPTPYEIGGPGVRFGQ